MLVLLATILITLGIRQPKIEGKPTDCDEDSDTVGKHILGTHHVMSIHWQAGNCQTRNRVGSKASPQRFSECPISSEKILPRY